MPKPEPLDPQDVGQVLGLIVHDLRNPAATISANVDFLKEVGPLDDEAAEALEDIRIAAAELRRGLDLVAWVGRWLLGQSPVESGNGDVGIFISRLEKMDTAVPINVTLKDKADLYAQGAQAVAEIVQVLLHNVKVYGGDSPAEISAYRDGEEVVVEIQDKGIALAKEYRKLAFTLKGQRGLKGKSEGRYSRFVGMLAAAVAIEGIGGAIEADGVDGASIFRLRLKATKPSSPPKG